MRSVVIKKEKNGEQVKQEGKIELKQYQEKLIRGCGKGKSKKER